MISSEHLGHTPLNRRWIAKPSSKTRLDKLRDSQPGSSRSAVRPISHPAPSTRLDSWVEEEQSRKRRRLEAGPSLGGQADLSPVFSLESSRLFKRHMRYKKDKQALRPWDLNSDNPDQYVHVEDSLIQRERAGVETAQDQCPHFAEEPSGSA